MTRDLRRQLQAMTGAGDDWVTDFVVYVWRTWDDLLLWVGWKTSGGFLVDSWKLAVMPVMYHSISLYIYPEFGKDPGRKWSLTHEWVACDWTSSLTDSGNRSVFYTSVCSCPLENTDSAHRYGSLIYLYHICWAIIHKVPRLYKMLSPTSCHLWWFLMILAYVLLFSICGLGTPNNNLMGACDDQSVELRVL